MYSIKVWDGKACCLGTVTVGLSITSHGQLRCRTRLRSARTNAYACLGCIESRHNEADYRKIVHEYLESGKVWRKGRQCSVPNVELTSPEISAERDRLHDDEGREATDLRPLFNGLRISGASHRPVANLR